MPELIKAKEPFRFYTRMHLSELTGLRANSLNLLANLIKEAPDSCIYNHTHRFLQQHQYLSPEPPNDFAYWVAEILGEKELGERLGSIDTMRFDNIAVLKERLAATIEDYLKDHWMKKIMFAREGEEFYFMKTISFILPTNYIAYDLKEFAELLRKITVDSIYFHIFEARLRLGRKTNDFSHWMEDSFGNKRLAGRIASLDLYHRTLEDLRGMIIKLIEDEIN